MQPPEMSLDVLPAELGHRLPGIREQPLDQPPIPPRRCLPPPPDAHQKRRPAIQYETIIVPFPRAAAAWISRGFMRLPPVLGFPRFGLLRSWIQPVSRTTSAVNHGETNLRKPGQPKGKPLSAKERAQRRAAAVKTGRTGAGRECGECMGDQEDVRSSRWGDSNPPISPALASSNSSGFMHLPPVPGFLRFGPLLWWIQSALEVARLNSGPAVLPREGEGGFSWLESGCT